MTSTTTKHRQQGFTLVELTLSIAFLGSLILIASSIIVQTISIYNKGVALKQINQAGRSLVEDINRLSSSGFEVRVADNGKTGYLCIKDTNEWRSYTWSSVQAGAGTTATANPKQFTLDSEPVPLVRSNEGVNGNAYCQLPSGGLDVPMQASEVTPILTKQVRILSVDITTGTNTAMKKIAFWIGTHDDSGSVPGMTPDFDSANSTWRCRGGNLGNFCAVSKFETVIYTPNIEE
jgi:Tfp pilus assembly protein PilE